MKYLETVNKCIYIGAYDVDETGKNVIINIEGHNVLLSLNNIEDSTQFVMKMLKLSDVEYICKYSHIAKVLK